MDRRRMAYLASTLPFQRWTDGKWREVVCHMFDTNVPDLSKALRTHARQNGLKVKVQETKKGERVAFRFTTTN